MKNIKEIFKYLLVFITTYISVSPFIIEAIEYGNLLSISFIVICGLVILINKGKFNRTLLSVRGKICSVFIMLIILSAFLNSDKNISSYVAFVVKLLIGLLLTLCFNFKEYKKIYVRIMTASCIISLIGIAIVLYFPDLIYRLSFEEQEAHSYIYYNAGIYIFMKNKFIAGFLLRNNGFSWEPGVWQALANLALLFDLEQDTTNLNSKRWIRIIIFISTIITTGSTTGYIILVCIIITYRKKLFNCNGVFGKKIIIIYLALLLFSIYFTLTKEQSMSYATPIWFEQISNYNSITKLLTRMDLKDIPYLLQHPFVSLFGFSLSSTLFTKGHSNGIVAYWISFGSIFIFTYLFTLYQSYKRITKHYFIWFIISIMILMSEVLTLQPIFTCLLFFGIGEKIKTDTDIKLLDSGNI